MKTEKLKEFLFVGKPYSDCHLEIDSTESSNASTEEGVSQEENCTKSHHL